MLPTEARAVRGIKPSTSVHAHYASEKKNVPFNLPQGHIRRVHIRRVIRRVRSLPLLFGYTLDKSANCRVVQFQVTCDFHLTVPVLVYRL